MELVTPELREALLANGRVAAAGGDVDPRPLAKLFQPDGKGVWLLTEMDPADEDRLYGLVDLGLGAPECGEFSLAEVSALRGPLGLPVERDAAFRPDKALSSYELAAADAGFVRA